MVSLKRQKQPNLYRLIAFTRFITRAKKCCIIQPKLFALAPPLNKSEFSTFNQKAKSFKKLTKLTKC